MVGGCGLIYVLEWKHGPECGACCYPIGKGNVSEKSGGGRMQSDIAQFVFVFLVEIVRLLYFDEFPDVGIVNMNVC